MDVEPDLVASMHACEGSIAFNLAMQGGVGDPPVECTKSCILSLDWINF
jgi:hypothetical protein